MWKLAIKKFLKELIRVRSYGAFLRLINKTIKHLTIASRGLLSISSKQEFKVTPPWEKQFFISIIVPSYNHSEYLKERLDSIFEQTYTNYEVIILDDASSDHSVEIIMEYIRKNRVDIGLHVNKINSGSGYSQWLKGIQLAKGDLIWIAESDDTSDPSFLETLVSAFKNPAVNMAFCNSLMFSGSKDNVLSSMKDYWFGKTSINPDEDFLLSNQDFLFLGFDQNNLIPNVSSCVFRKPSQSTLESPWSRMRIAGDWLFYVACSQSALIFHSAKALNYYRIHKNSTIALNRTTPEFIFEIKRVRQHILDITSRLRVLIVIPGFVIGGAESFAIRLATALWHAGYNVAILDLRILPEEIDSIPSFSLPPIYSPKNFKLYLRKCHEQFDVIHTHHASADVIVSREINPSLKHLISLHGMYEQMNVESMESIVKNLEGGNQAFTYLHRKNFENFPVDFVSNHRFYKVENFVYANPDINEIDCKVKSFEESLFKFVLISRAIPDKGWALAIESIRILRKATNINVQLYLIGIGPEYERLIKVNRESWVNLVGGTNEPMSIAKHMDFGLFLSTYPGESTPMVLMEFLHCGLPTIFMNVGNAKEVMSDELGVIGFEVNRSSDAITIADALRDAVETEVADLELIKKRSLNKAKEYSSQEILPKYLQIYQEILSSDFSSNNH